MSLPGAKTERGKLWLWFALACLLALAGGLWSRQVWQEIRPWSAAEKDLLRSLWLESLPALPPDPSNAVAGLPLAAALGRQLFFDTRLSLDGTVSCASCHQPQRRFTDGLPTARALGSSARNTPPLVGIAYSPWFYWDGRKDSQWAQALSPLEDPAEHGGNRMRLARLLISAPQYREGYIELFGPAPDFSDPARFPADAAPGTHPDWHRNWEAMREDDRHLVTTVFTNLGKLLAAWERTLQPGPSRFDAYVGAVLAGDDTGMRELFTPDERAGLRLFIGEARCLECHNGPLFTNNEFHNTGVLPPPGAVPDQGRFRVLEQLQTDTFNCLGPYSDAPPELCRELRYMRRGTELIGAMRTPSLRNLEGTAPYMHKGQLATLGAVLDHYNRAPPALIGHNEAEPLGLSERELRQLEAFLGTLDAPFAARQ